jgi:uncharacterized membrane protein YfcA
MIPQITQAAWALALFASFCTGLGKAGLKGVDMLSVMLMALVFGGKASTGVILPLLCLGDIGSVAYYRRHARWEHFRKLVPWMVAGILLGVFLGKNMDEALFRRIMAVIILVTIGIVLLMEYGKVGKAPEHPLFAASTGLAAGFTTMIGNMAGAFANLYFLAMRVVKNDFIGTAAWIFLFINLFKLPFQAFYWKNITRDTLSADIFLLPTLLIGFWLGLKIVRRVPDDQYRKVVMVLTLIGCVLMLVKK